ncbi:hypothetical protein BC826DRAFT_701768 [Russula brevipes]|nr:hypothetical protein BC826DRAFT_701768 [Russula brevipes]
MVMVMVMVIGPMAIAAPHHATPRTRAQQKFEKEKKKRRAMGVFSPFMFFTRDAKSLPRKEGAYDVTWRSSRTLDRCFSFSSSSSRSYYQPPPPPPNGPTHTRWYFWRRRRGA